MKPKRVVCSRCELPIYDSEKMIIIPTGSTEAVSHGGDIGSRTTTEDTLRHGDTSTCMERLKIDARLARQIIGRVAHILRDAAEELDE